MPPDTTEGGKMGIVNDTMCSLLEEKVYFVDFWQGAVLQGKYKLEEKVFETGFRELVGVFQRSHDKKALKAYYLENEERFRRLDDYVIDAMGALIGKSKLKEFKHENGGIDMCKAFEDEREEGRLEGRLEGRREGEQSALTEVLKNLMNSLSMTVDEALQAMMIPEKEWARYKELV